MSEWRPILGNAWYEVSRSGEVRSVDRVVARTDGTPLRVTGRTLKQRLAWDGYQTVWLANGTPKGKTARVHTLVLEAFVGPRPDGMQCRHLNGDCYDNRVENLAWGTCAENALDRIAHGTMPAGERHARSKLTNAQVQAIRSGWAAGKSGPGLAREFGINQATVYSIVHRKTWRHL